MEVIRRRKRRIKRNSEELNNTNLVNDSVLDGDLEKNITDFRQFVGFSQDIVIRRVKITLNNGINSAIFYIEGLTDKELINNSVIRPLTSSNRSNQAPEYEDSDTLIKTITENIITHVKLEQSGNWVDILDKMFSGDAILLVEGLKTAVIIGARKWADRGVEQPTNEQVIRGPRDSFTENLETNTVLLRRRIKSQKLQFESLKIGNLTKTNIKISYINGIANPKLIEEVRKRLSRIETDAILETNMIEEFIEDNPFSPLPQVAHTERPDHASSQLLEGRVIIMVDGVPNVLMVPTSFWRFFYSPEDYYQRVYSSFLIRSLRIISLLVALCLPSFYIAITSFHQELIPIGLLNIIISGRRFIPFPIVIEVFIMEFILEVIREAGVRLPLNVGQAISIVGALVLGQAAIQAKIASPATVTVVAITAIANFTIPFYSASFSIRILRFALIIISGTLGIFGFLTALFVFLTHLCSLRSFGEPYMAPFAPLVPSDFKDSLVRQPIWAMNNRPSKSGIKDKVRQKSGLKPGPEKGKGDKSE